MDVKLVVKKGSSQTRVLRLRAPHTTVGRQKGCGLRIPSGQVSRRHCVLSVQNGYVTVEDLESVNGTLLNGQRISGRQVVRPGDQLEVGPIRFVVQYELSQQAIDQMLQGSGAALPAAEEELDVLPLADDDLVLEEASDDSPVVAEAVEAELVAEPAELEDEVLEPVPVDEEESETMAQGWKLPEADDLRDLLAQMDVKKPKRT